VTTKEYFNLLIETSESGGFPAITKGNKCAYRGEGGRRCAVGIIMPDHVYKESMEGAPASNMFEKGIVDWSWLPMKNGVTILASDLNSIQEVHDMQVKNTWSRIGVWDPDKFEAALRELWVFDDVEK